MFEFRCTAFFSTGNERHTDNIAEGSDHTQMVQPEAAPAEVEVLATGVGPG
jgi:hypothetical protein